MKIVWTVEAADDLANVLDYFAHRSPAGATSVASAIAATTTSISQFPHAGRMDPETGCRERLVERYPLLLIYAAGADVVEIIALFHTSRDPVTKRRAQP